MMEKSLLNITFIRIVHSAIWLIMAGAVFYILYCGICDKLSAPLYFAVGLIFLEMAVLWLNRGACPLTDAAKKAKPDWKDGDDIFLPKWLAINNKMIFGSLFILGIILVIFRLIF